MMIHTGTVTAIDRIALSNLLYELAESFTEEAERWKPRNKGELQRTGRLLAELARGVLSGAAQFTTAEAYADAGALQLARAVAQRRALTSILTPPNRTSGADRG